MPYITFSKSYSASDDGSKLAGADIGQLQADIAQILNGGITNVNISGTAAIIEAKIAFDATAGHTHNGTDSANVAGGNVLRADITGCEPQYVSVDTVNAQSGALELNNIVYTRNAISSTINLSTDTHWVGGTNHRAISSTFYIYAYNDSGTTWDIKYWDSAPQFANCGTDTQSTLIFRQSAGVWYRCIGTAVTNATGSGELSDTSVEVYPVAIPSSLGIPTIFSIFGGNEENGAKTISADANFSDHDGTTVGVAQYTSLTIDVTKTLTINTKYAYIGVSGNCTIHGTISANGNLSNEGATATGGKDSKANLVGITAGNVLQSCLGGSGGSGGCGNSGGQAAGNGGSAGSVGATAGGGGGAVGVAGTATCGWNLGLGINLLSSEIFSGGGGGGGGGFGAAGGAGGGIIYIEVAGDLIYDGTIDVGGATGIANASGGGGGGGGGVLIIRAKTITTNTGVTTSSGGAGGAGGASGAAGGAGGAGYSKIVEP